MWRPPLWWLLAAVALGLGALFWLPRRPRVAAALALAAMAAAGAFSIAAHDAHSSAPDISRFTEVETLVTGHVVRDGLARRGAFGDQRLSVDLETEEVTLGGVTTKIKAGLRVTIYSREQVESDDDSPSSRDPPAGMSAPYNYGQRLRFPAKVRLPRNYGNPGALDYRGYLARQGVVGMATVRADRIEVLAGFVGSRAALLGSRARRSVLGRIHALWPEQGPGLMDAMLIGERAYIGRDTSVSFQRTGAYHILVVSGMNVGILAFVVFWVFRRVRIGEVAAALATMGVAAGYAYVCEMGAPVTRAVLMLSVYLGARLLYRDRALLNAVGTAALALLAMDPRTLFDTSFQLTFVAVVAIAGIGVPLMDRTSQPVRRALRYIDSTSYDFALSPKLVQFRLDLRLIIDRFGRLFGATVSRWAVVRLVRVGLASFEVLLVSALMQVAMALPMAAYFHRATMLALPANALVVPLTGVLMPAATAAVALAYIWMPLATIPALVAGAALDVITGAVRVLGGLRVAEVRVATPGLVVGLFAVAAFAFAMWAIPRRALLATAGVVALAGAAVCVTVIPPRPQLRPGVLEFTAIDVGQADSTLIVTPEGKTLLVDAAGSLGAWRSEFDFGEDVISPYLWSRGLTRVDAVVLTHAHSDHIGGMRAVVANFRPRELWLGPTPDSGAVRALLEEAARQGTRAVKRLGGDSFAFGGAQFRILSPPPYWAPPGAKARNNDSLVMEIRLGNTAALIEGDAERRMEREFVNAQPRADLLKVAHNGSSSSTDPELLRVTRPRFAVISVGTHNSFGHPRSDVLQRLAAAGATTYRTDALGAITFYLDGNLVTPKLAALRLR